MGNGPATAVYNQANWELVEHKTDFDGFAAMMESEMPRALAQEFERVLNTDREERRAQGMSMSQQLAQHAFGSGRQAQKAESKLIYLWEMRMRRYRNAYRLLEWKRLLDKGAPKAEAIQQHVKIDLGI